MFDIKYIFSRLNGLILGKEKGGQEGINFKKDFIKKQFKNSLGYDLNIDEPKTFNEKLQWLKLYYYDSLLTNCADKVGVREFVKEKIGERYLSKIFGVWDDVDEIKIEELPDSFALKVNHGSGQNIICKDKGKLNWEEAKKKLEIWMKPESNHYFYSFEWCYKDISPKIICEEYLEQQDGKLLDFKFLCFDGEPRFIWVDIDRFERHRRNFYDLDWNFIADLQLQYPNDVSVIIEKPSKLEEMLDVAKKLSRNFPHVRVDLYAMNNKVYFGELTFYSENGMGRFSSNKWDHKLGEMLKLPNLK